MMKKRILVVDDDLGAREGIKMVLLKNCNVDVDTAEDSQEALKKLKENKYDLITTDLRRPGMHGVEFVSIIRKDIDKDIPIIVITGFGSNKSREHLLEGGLVSAYFGKPFSSSEIANTVTLLISDDCGNC